MNHLVCALNVIKTDLVLSYLVWFKALADSSDSDSQVGNDDSNSRLPQVVRRQDVEESIKVKRLILLSAIVNWKPTVYHQLIFFY